MYDPFSGNDNSIGLMDLGKRQKPFRKVLKLTPAYFAIRRREKEEKRKEWAKKETARKQAIADRKKKEKAEKAERERIQKEKEAIEQAEVTKAKAQELVIAKESVKVAEQTGDPALIKEAQADLKQTDKEYTEEVHELVQDVQEVQAEKQEEVQAEQEAGVSIEEEKPAYEEAAEELIKEETETIEGFYGLGKIKWLKKLAPALSIIPGGKILAIAAKAAIKVPKKVKPKAAVAPGEAVAPAEAVAPERPKWIIPIVIGGGVLVLGTIIYFVTKKK